MELVQFLGPAILGYLGGKVLIGQKPKSRPMMFPTTRSPPTSPPALTGGRSRRSRRSRSRSPRGGRRKVTREEIGKIRRSPEWIDQYERIMREIADDSKNWSEIARAGFESAFESDDDLASRPPRGVDGILASAEAEAVKDTPSTTT